MTETNKLYLVKLRGMQFNPFGTAYGISYIVAVNPNDAFMKVKLYLEDKKIGFISDRELESVTLIAEQTDYPNCKTKLYI